MLSNTMIHDLTCSIGHMSGEHAGYGNTLMLLAPRTFCMILCMGSGIVMMAAEI